MVEVAGNSSAREAEMTPKLMGSRAQMRQNSAMPQNRVFGREHFCRTLLQFQQRRPQVQRPCPWWVPLKIEEGDAGHGSDGVRRRRRTRFNRVRCHWWTVSGAGAGQSTETVSGAGAGQSRPSPGPCPAPAPDKVGPPPDRVGRHFVDPQETVSGATFWTLQNRPSKR